MLGYVRALSDLIHAVQRFIHSVKVLVNLKYFLNYNLKKMKNFNF